MSEFTTLPMRYKKLASHTGIYGDTGGGKGLFLSQYLDNVERQGDVAIIWDPDREYARKFFDKMRGDWILDPTVEQCPYWDIRKEIVDEGTAMGVAACFFPDNPSVRDPYWNNTARGLFAFLSSQDPKPTISELGHWMAHDELIDQRVQGTEFERILTHSSPGLRSSVIGHMNQVAQPLRMMPQHSEGRRTFAIREYLQKRNSWIFVTSTPGYSDALKPLHQAWMSLFIQGLIDMGSTPDLPVAHVIFEEASSFIVQAFITGLRRLRKTGNPCVYAIQNFADFKAAYGEHAETIYSQPYHKVFFRASSDITAQKVEATVGKRRLLKLRENVTLPMYFWGRRQRMFSYSIEKEPVVDSEVFQNLQDQQGFIAKPGKIAAFSLPIFDRPDRTTITPRVIPPLMRDIGVRVPVQPALVSAEIVEAKHSETRF